jgi:hemerythrin
MSQMQDEPKFAVVPDLHWSSQLETGDGRMDEIHVAFVEILARLRATPHDQQLPLFKTLTAHTVEHFEQEDRWMLATGFTADNCHTKQHQSILETMRAVEEHYIKGDTEIISRMADALAEWFPSHAATMDAGLAKHMATLSFDTHTETLPDPSKVRPATMSGCGSVSCS